MLFCCKSEEKKVLRTFTDNLILKNSGLGQKIFYWLLSVGLGEYAKSVLLYNGWTAIYSNGWTVMCTIVQCQTVMYPTVQWLDSAVSSCLMVGLCCVKLSNGWTILCPTVWWLDSALSNCPIVGHCCVNLYNGLTVLCPIVLWLVSEKHIFFIFYALKQEVLIFYTLKQNCKKLYTFCPTFFLSNSLKLSEPLMYSISKFPKNIRLCSPNGASLTT